mmetsp:Transcript_44063/g.133469  ORF Transcript_44063/g.133469 Transcript_44063/m.133469 type:complete len:201 (+) Transcript_44063:153-755(+)
MISEGLCVKALDLITRAVLRNDLAALDDKPVLLGPLRLAVQPRTRRGYAVIDLFLVHGLPILDAEVSPRWVRLLAVCPRAVRPLDYQPLSLHIHGLDPGKDQVFAGHFFVQAGFALLVIDLLVREGARENDVAPGACRRGAAYHRWPYVPRGLCRRRVQAHGHYASLTPLSRTKLADRLPVIRDHVPQSVTEHQNTRRGQ